MSLPVYFLPERLACLASVPNTAKEKTAAVLSEPQPQDLGRWGEKYSEQMERKMPAFAMRKWSGQTGGAIFHLICEPRNVIPREKWDPVWNGDYDDQLERMREQIIENRVVMQWLMRGENPKLCEFREKSLANVREFAHDPKYAYAYAEAHTWPLGLGALADYLHLLFCENGIYEGDVGLTAYANEMRRAWNEVEGRHLGYKIADGAISILGGGVV